MNKNNKLASISGEHKIAPKPRIITKLGIEGCCLVGFPQHPDERGMFKEIYRDEHFKELGLPTEWAQDNESKSHYGVIRGLHIQKKNPQGKLLRCVVGRIWDVAVDLREDSPTFKKWIAVALEDSMGTAIYIPPGCAHGFMTISEMSVVHYKCTTGYDRFSDGGINPFDPELDIPWPLAQVKISNKDQELPNLADYLK